MSMEINKINRVAMRDWVVAGVVVVWGGLGIYDRLFKPSDEQNPPGIVKEFDLDKDGKLSDLEIKEAKEMLDEFKKWKALNGKD